MVGNADECEIVGHGGGLKTVRVGGALTGEPVDLLIVDDVYKDAQSAWSPVVRESISDWYDTVAETRLHNDSKQLIVFTRWHEDDLAGTLLRQRGVYDPINSQNGWKVVVYKVIKEGEANEYDQRREGGALWPEKHSLEKLPLIFCEILFVIKKYFCIITPSIAQAIYKPMNLYVRLYIVCDYTCLSSSAN